NQLVDIGETTKDIKKGKSKTLPVKLKLPKDVTNHHVKIFALKGTKWSSSDQTPGSNIVILGETVPVEEPETEPRTKINFNAAWQFIKEDVAGAEDPLFDDSGWETVSTPHTYNDIDTFDNFME